MKYINYYLFAVFFLMTLSCSTDNPSNTTDNNQNTINCNVSGDMNMNFKSSSAVYIKYQSGQIIMFADMHLNPNEIYTIQIKFNDTLNKTDFDLFGSEPLTYFERANLTSTLISYSSNVTGNLSFTNKTADSLTGTFKFTASFIDTVNSVTKTINITDGNFAIKKINE